MYRISKEFAFSASHQLEHLPPEHQCSRLHGHNYVVRVLLAGQDLDPNGFILDYGELRPFRRWIDTHLDHRHLNDVLSFTPTAELMAYHLALRVEEFVPDGVAVAVEVSETPKTWAGYYPPGWLA